MEGSRCCGVATGVPGRPREFVGLHGGTGLAIRAGMPFRVLLAVLLVAAASGSALAQAPGQTPPLEASAVPPLPENIPSPRPTLPPPEGQQQMAVVFDNGGFSAVIGEDGS